MNKSRKRVFRSITEFEKEFLPISYKERLENDENDDPEAFGAKVAAELLESIRQQLRMHLSHTSDKS